MQDAGHRRVDATLARLQIFAMAWDGKDEAFAVTVGRQEKNARMLRVSFAGSGLGQV